MKALLCAILDRSGSMSGRETDVIGGVNKFIEEQKAVPGEARLSLVRFDTEYEKFRPIQPLNEVEPLKRDEYVPRGSTALLDAIGRTLFALDMEWSLYQPDKCIVVIVTDGQENASREFKHAQIKAQIESREKSGKWTFIYLGADVTTFDDAAGLGIQMSNTAQYSNTAAGTKSLYSTVSASVGSLRSGATHAGLGGVIPEDDKPQDTPPQPTTWTPPPAA